MLECCDEVVCIEELSTPRPHYRVTLKSVVRGHPDLLPRLLPDEMIMTMCLPVDVGSDLKAIKHAAAHRFAVIAAETAAYQRKDHRPNIEPDKTCPTQLDRHNEDGRSQEERQPAAAKSDAE